jgi:chemotaxis signal transduction protein
MDPDPETEPVRSQTFDVLLFRLGSFLLGAPADQVRRIGHGDLARELPDSQALDLKDIFPVPDTGGADLPPVFLDVAGLGHRLVVRVDAAEGVIALDVGQIRRLPPLIDAHKSHPCLSGLAVLEDRMAFLLDLHRLTRSDP